MGAGGSVEECFPEADEQTRQKLKEAYEAKYKDSSEEDMRAGMQKEYEQLIMPSKTATQRVSAANIVNTSQATSAE